MNSSSTKVLDLEKSWWSLGDPEAVAYKDLPATSKWVCRFSQDGLDHLHVSCAGFNSTFPAYFTAIFMLLDLQQLSSLAESVRQECDLKMSPVHLRNVVFLDRMRQHLLAESIGPSKHTDDDYLIALKRWIIRLIHGIPNYAPLRQSYQDEIGASCVIFDDDTWKKGEVITNGSLHWR